MQTILFTIQRSALSIHDIIGKDPANFSLKQVGPAINTIIQLLVGFSGTIALIFLIYGGILYLTSAGNQEQTTQAKGTITWSLIGLILILAAFAAVRFVSDVFLTGVTIK